MQFHWMKFYWMPFHWTYKWEKQNKKILKRELIIFYNDQINLKDFDARLLKIDKKDYHEIDIYYIGYVTIKKVIIIILTV